MSSYLNFYLLPKEGKGDSPLLLTSFSRNSEIYQIFYENMSISSDFEKKTEVTHGDILSVLEEAKYELKKQENYLTRLEQACRALKSSSDDNVESYMSMLDEIENTKSTISKIEFLESIISDFHFSDFSKLFVTID